MSADAGAARTPLKVGVLPPVRAGVCVRPEWIGPFARGAEELGFESVVVVEHPLVVTGTASRYPYAPSGRMPLPDDCDVPDPLDLLAFLAGSTSRIGLATGVLILPAHHPVVLAKRLATLDRLSGGRVRLCIGVGWMREELEACGTEFSSRGRRTDESIDVLRALWSDAGAAGASHDGEFFHFTGAQSFPKPARPGGVPIHIGGHSPASIRRAARRGDGWQPLGLAGDELASALSRLREETAEVGRDPDAIEITLGDLATKATPERMAALAASGADRVVLSCLAPELDDALAELDDAARRLGIEPLGDGGAW
jgi:probable F420-dependent oxidoreductase